MKHNPLQTGAFFFFLLPLFLFGVMRALRDWKKEASLLLGWILALLPSTLSGNPHALRLLPSLPFVIGLISLGRIELDTLVTKKFQRFINPLIVAVGLMLVTVSWPLYLVETFNNSQEWFSYSRDMSLRARELQEQGYNVYFDEVIAEPHIFLAYWNKIDPTVYQNLPKAETVDSFGFKRPTQLGETINFRAPRSTDIACGDASPKIAVFHKPKISMYEDLAPQQVFKGKSETHTFAELHLFVDANEVLPDLASSCLTRTESANSAELQ